MFYHLFTIVENFNLVIFQELTQLSDFRQKFCPKFKKKKIYVLRNILTKLMQVTYVELTQLVLTVKIMRFLLFFVVYHFG